MVIKMKELLKKIPMIHFVGRYVQMFFCFIWSEHVEILYECNRYIRKKISKEDMDIKRIQEFKGKYKGQRCFVVATGPSLTVEDLNTLHKNNEVVFSMNTIVKAFEKTEFRPTFYCIQDKEVYLKNKDKICCYQLPYILIRRANVPLKRVRIEKKELPIDKNVYMYRLNAIYHWTQVVYGNTKKQLRFSFDCAEEVFDGSTIAYSVLQLATYMGFKEIYLLGADCDYSGAVSHFDGTKAKTSAANGEIFIKSYQAAKKNLENSDVKIYNATRGGKLEVFPRVEFDELFHK